MSDQKKHLPLILVNLLEHFSPLHPLQTKLLPRKDGIIESPYGCFRLAYSEESHAVALFYARSLYDLDGGVTAGNGAISENAKQRILLVKMDRLHHDNTPRLDPADGRRRRYL